jgi:peptidoglycan/xylan/chitin deacetylase (PgdA/CDA1 family)
VAKETQVLKKAIKNVIPNSLMRYRLDKQAESSILLTFDDGPDENITPFILERLEEYRARAVFFVVGSKVKETPHLLKLIKARGHLIGNHSYSHPKGELPGLSSFFTYRRDLIKCQDIIEKTIGTKPTLFRPPRGINPTSLLAAKSLDLRIVLYSIEGGEWGYRKSSDAQTIGRELAKSLRPRDIVLLHDDNSKVPMILDIIMPAIENKKVDTRNGVNNLI